MDVPSAGTVRFLKLPEVLDRIGISRTSVYDLIREGKFPQPVRIGRSTLWPDHVIREWQEGVMRGEN